MPPSARGSSSARPTARPGCRPSGRSRSTRWRMRRQGFNQRTARRRATTSRARYSRPASSERSACGSAPHPGTAFEGRGGREKVTSGASRVAARGSSGSGARARWRAAGGWARRGRGADGRDLHRRCDRLPDRTLTRAPVANTYRASRGTSRKATRRGRRCRRADSRCSAMMRCTIPSEQAMPSRSNSTCCMFCQACGSE